ncbi:MATE family efflux transporter [Burkholderia ubonensis]|uniref:MATE family efflux transporter n=1 Tax=Burkholderia ubonensis TaxID=101571 RepID=UPI0009B31D08|nr:MATE family efflux transporter [Burkholderia ubonensis]AYZ66267.1 MATE family efflux transporter [Burkholderia multivorans]
MNASDFRMVPSRNEVLRPLLTQSLPLLIAQLASSAYGIVDLMLIGHLNGEHAMAVFGVSWNIFNTIQIGFTGILIALIPAISSAHGAGNRQEVAETVRQGIWLALALSLPICLLLVFPDLFLSLAGQRGQATAEIRLFLLWLAVSVPPTLLFRVVSGYASALLKTRKILMASVAGLIVKIPLSFVLVQGGLGHAGLGVVGCAISTAVVTWVLLAVGFGTVLTDTVHGGREALTRFSRPRAATLSTLMRQGLPIGASFFFDYSVLTLIGLLVARGGQIQAAAHGVAASVSYLCYLVPMSLANVASAMVGQSLGRHDGEAAGRVGQTAVTLTLSISFVIGLVLVSGGDLIARLYTSDASVADYAARLIVVVGVYHLFDAIFTVCSGVLRAYRRTLVPTVILGIALWGIGLAGGAIANRWSGASQTALVFWWALAAAAIVAAAGIFEYQRRVVQDSGRPQAATS